MSRALQDLLSRLTERVGNNTTFWIEAEKIDAINEAISVWGCLTGEFTDSIVAVGTTTPYVTHADSIVVIQRILDIGASTDTPLTASSLPEFDRGWPGWEDLAHSAPRLWARVTHTEFATYPPPPNGRNFSVHGLTEAPWLAAAGEEIDLNEEDINSIIDYAHHVLTFKEGGAEFEATKPMLKRFFSQAAIRNERLRAMAFYRKFMGASREEDQKPDRLPPKTLGGRS